MKRAALPHIQKIVAVFATVTVFWMVGGTFVHAQSPSSGPGAPPLFFDNPVDADMTTPGNARPDTGPGAPPLFDDGGPSPATNYTANTDGSSNTTQASSGGDSGTTANPSQTPISPKQAEENAGGFLYNLMTSIGGFFTWIGGGILDYAVAILVVQMGYLLTGNIGVAVDTLWTVVRDLFNIIFIFALIWIGLQTILSASDSNLKKSLGGLIVAALLINFSLFITKAIVDFSNIAAAQIYTSAFGAQSNNGQLDLNDAVGTIETGIIPAYQTAAGFSISSAFMANLELNSFARELKADGPIWQTITYGFLVMVLQIIAGFVFLAGGILLIYRFVALVIYMILSPAMFLGLVLPKLAGKQRAWWEGLLKNAFIAPAYLFMLYLCLMVFAGVGGGSTVEVDTFAGGYSATSIADGSFAIFLYFAVMVGFLLAAPKVASEMGVFGASSVVRVGNAGANTLRGWGKGLAMAPVGYGKRVGQNAGASVYNRLPFVGGKSYEKSEAKLKEARAKKAAGMELSASDKWALGYGKVRGAGSLDDRAAALKAGTEYKPFGGKSQKERSAAAKALTAENTQQQSRMNLLTSIDSGLGAEKDSKEYIAMVDKITSASPAEVSKVLGKYEKEGEEAKYREVVDNLSPNQFKKVLEQKEEDFSEKSKNKLRGVRTESTRAKLEWDDKNKTGQTLQSGLKQASVADLATLDFNNDLLGNAAYLQGTQLDDMKKDDFFSGPRFNAIKSKHEAQINTWLAEGNYSQIIDSRKGSVNIAKLPATALKNKGFMAALVKADKLNISLLSQMASSKDIDDADRPAIGNAAREALRESKGDLPETYKRFFNRGVGQNLTDGDYSDDT